LEQHKEWWKSKGVWGSFGVILATIAGFWGTDLDAATVTDLGLQGATFITGVIALVGRFTAKHRLK